MQEISQLLHVFATKVAEQQLEVSHILEDAETSRQHIRDGSRELQQVVNRPSTLRDFVCAVALGLALVLLFLDWYHS